MGVAAGLLSWRNEFDSRAVHIGFVVDKVALGQIRLPVIWFYLIAIIPPLLHVNLLINYGRCILAVYSVYVFNTHTHTHTHIHTREKSLNIGNLRICAKSSSGIESS